MCPKRAWKLLTPSPYLALSISSPGLFLSGIFYNKLVIVKCFLEFCKSFWGIVKPEEGIVGTLEFVAKSDSSTSNLVSIWYWQLAPGVGSLWELAVKLVAYDDNSGWLVSG